MPDVQRYLRGKDKKEKRFVVAKPGTELSLFLTLRPIIEGKNPTPSFGEKIAWEALESLSACRVLLEEAGECLESGSYELYERIAAQLSGVRGECEELKQPETGILGVRHDLHNKS